ncbi:MAG: hypothetical protein LBL00_08520 [Endomicrobium sp.]|jgi:hypothetical protein|nr:hypothetical protein [Endomicrobium sp.]
MNAEEFMQIVERRIEKVKETLKCKGEEYAKTRKGLCVNRMHNFYRAAGLLGSTAVAALRGMWVKHVVSINDIVDDIEAGRPVKRGLVEEKLTDNIAYLLLLDGVLAVEPLVIPDDKASDYIESLRIFDELPTKYFKGHSSSHAGTFIDFHTGKCVSGMKTRNFEPCSKKIRKEIKEGDFAK